MDTAAKVESEVLDLTYIALTAIVEVDGCSGGKAAVESTRVRLTPMMLDAEVAILISFQWGNENALNCAPRSR